METNGEKSYLDKVFTLKEAAKKWVFADSLTIKRAIEKGKFKNDEIKESGSVWLVTLEGMERVFGPIGANNSYIINRKELCSILSKIYLKDIKEGFLNLTDKDEDVLRNMEQRVTNIFINGYISLRDGKIIVIANGVNKKPWQIINSFEEYMLFLNILEKKRLLTEDRKINIVREILTV